MLFPTQWYLKQPLLEKSPAQRGPRAMRFGRHLKEVLVPGKEDNCVRYDELKSAIKTQLVARWGCDDDARRAESDSPTTSALLEEGLLEHSEDAIERRSRAFYDLLASEIERVARLYDASVAQVRDKVESLLCEARRGDVLDALQATRHDDEGEGSAGSPRMNASRTSGSFSAAQSPRRGAQHEQQLDRAFRHVYHEVTLLRHNTSLNYTGLRKIVKKFLKKTCAAADASGASPDGRPLRVELRGLLDAIPAVPVSAAREAEGAGVQSVLFDRDGNAGAQSRPRTPPGGERPASVSAVAPLSSPPTTPPRRARSHIPLSPSSGRERFRVTAESAERDTRERLRALPFTEGAELAALAEQLEKAYAGALALEATLDSDDPEYIRRVARRRLRLLERPAPPAADWVFAYGAGVSTCAILTIALAWFGGPAGSRGFGTLENLEYFVACVPAFRLTAIPVLWLWCWAGVTRACTAHHINYRFIMEVSRSEEAGWRWNAALAATLTAAWLTCFALFSARVRFGVDPFGAHAAPAYYPLALVVFVLSLLAVPPSSLFAARDEGGGARASLPARAARLFNPRARASLLRSIAHSVTAPFGGPVRFRDNLVADVACSLVRSLVDFLTTCWFFAAGEHERARPSTRRPGGPTSPILTCLPYWFRLQQCVRRFYDAKRGSRERVEHVVNAGKYFVSLVAICLAGVGGYVKIQGGFREDPGEAAWVFFLVFGTAYAYLWDIIMDWGLIEIDMPAREKRAGGKRSCFPVVRWAVTRDRVFRTRAFYAWALVSNLVGRMAWSVTVTPHGVGAAFLLRMGFALDLENVPGALAVIDRLASESVGTFVAVLELLRRAQWTFLRLENEYLNNAARYRSVFAAPMLLDDVGSSSWDQEWRFEREESDKNAKTGSVYVVVAANALVAAAVAAAFYAAYSS